MEEWKECKLSDICDYGKDRIEVSSLDNSNYISTVLPKVNLDFFIKANKVV